MINCIIGDADAWISSLPWKILSTIMIDRAFINYHFVTSLINGLLLISDRTIRTESTGSITVINSLSIDYEGFYPGRMEGTFFSYN